MFCPRCSHEQITETVRFCSKCGLPLEDVTDLLAANHMLTADERAQREKREIVGITLILVTALVSLIYLIVFGILTLSKVSDKSLLTLWITLLSIAVVLGTTGLVNLIRSGFFTRLDQRQNRHLERLKKKERNLESFDTGKMIEGKNALHVPAMLSVTESTTRNLAKEARNPDKAGEKQ
jgi:hypothetical protein